MTPRTVPAHSGGAFVVDVEAHIGWARAVARGVGQHYRLGKGSHEEQELEGVAYLVLVRKAADFDARLVPAGGDPGGQFRGWVHAHIRGECARAAVQLRNGGTFRSRRGGGRPVQVEPLPIRKTDDGGVVIDIPDHRETPDRCENCEEVTDLARAGENTGRVRRRWCPKTGDLIQGAD